MQIKAEAFDLWQYLCAETFDPLIRVRIDFYDFIDDNALKQSVSFKRDLFAYNRQKSGFNSGIFYPVE